MQLSDTEIAALIAEPKPLPDDYLDRVRTKPKLGHKERELDVSGSNGSEFRLILRESVVNSLAFSAILAYRAPNSSQWFRLRRYNGKNHEHTNVLENETFYDFHIHQATERYQLESGGREDSFAQRTDRFADFPGALSCLLADCNFIIPQQAQTALFGE